MSTTPQRRGPQRRNLAWITRPVTVVVIVAILVLGAAAGITAKLTTQNNVTVTPSATCHPQHAFVPAFFYASGIWQQAADTKPVPTYMILDISGLGAGTGPEAHFQSIVKKERAAGVTILGYSSTGYGSRPLSEVETDVRHYKAWYGVTDMFLDEVKGVTSQLPYYRKLAHYIRSYTPGTSIWINPGAYPAPSYMSVSNVVMAFEGSFAQYHNIDVPSWAFGYSSDRFANTIYATSGSQVNSAINMSKTRNAGYVYVTDGSGGNPYSALPSYWSTEDSIITQGCPNSAP
jgi:Spherulation-specific family 4